jgi:hypothetical protein
MIFQIHFSWRVISKFSRSWSLHAHIMPHPGESFSLGGFAARSWTLFIEQTNPFDINDDSPNYDDPDHDL